MGLASRCIAFLLVQLQLWTISAPLVAQRALASSDVPTTTSEADSLLRTISETEADLFDAIVLLNSSASTAGTSQESQSGTYLSGAFNLDQFVTQLAMVESRVLGWKQKIESYLTLRSRQFGTQATTDLTERRTHIMIAYFNAIGMIARLRLLPATRSLGVNEAWKQKFQLNVPLYSLAELYGMDGLPAGDPEEMGAAIMQIRSRLMGMNGVITPFQETLRKLPVSNQAVAGLSKSALQALHLRAMETLIPLQLGEKYLQATRIQALSSMPTDQSFVLSAASMTALNLFQNYIDLNGASDPKKRSISLPYIPPNLQEFLGSSEELSRTYNEYLRDMDEPGYREALLASFPVRPLIDSDKDDNTLAMSATQARQNGLEFADREFNQHFIETMFGTALNPVVIEAPSPEPTPEAEASTEPTLGQSLAENPTPSPASLAPTEETPVLPPEPESAPEPSLTEESDKTEQSPSALHEQVHAGAWEHLKSYFQGLLAPAASSPSLSPSTSPSPSPSPSRPRLSVDFVKQAEELKKKESLRQKEETEAFKKIAALEKLNVPFEALDPEKLEEFNLNVRRAEHLIFSDELAGLIRNYPLSFTQMDDVQRMGVLRKLVAEAKYRAVKPVFALHATDKQAETAKVLIQTRRDELALGLSYEFMSGWVRKAQSVFETQTRDTSHLEYVRGLLRLSYEVDRILDIPTQKLMIHPKIMTQAIRSLGLLQARTVAEDVGAVPYFFPTPGSTASQALDLILNAGNIASGTYYHLIGSSDIGEEALQWLEQNFSNADDYSKARSTFNQKVSDLLNYIARPEDGSELSLLSPEGTLDFEKASALVSYDRGLIASMDRSFRSVLKAATPYRRPDLSNPEITQYVRERFKKLAADLLVLGKLYGFHVSNGRGENGVPTLDQASFDGRSLSSSQVKAYKDALERDALGYGILTVRKNNDDGPQLYRRLSDLLERHGNSIESSLPEARRLVQDALDGMKSRVENLLTQVSRWNEKEPQKYLCDALGFLQMSALMHKTMKSEMFPQFSDYMARIADLYIMSCEAPTTWDRISATYHAPMDLLGWIFMGDMAMQGIKPFVPTSRISRWHDRLHHAASAYTAPYFAAMLPMMGIDMVTSSWKVDEARAKADLAKSFFLTSPTKSAFFDLFEVMDLQSQADAANYNWYFNAAFNVAFIGMMSQGSIKQVLHSARDQWDMARLRALFGPGSTKSDRYDLSSDAIRRASQLRIRAIDEWASRPETVSGSGVLNDTLRSMGFKFRSLSPGLAERVAPLLKWRIELYANGLINRTRSIQRWQAKTLRKFGPMLDQLGIPKNARSLHPMRVSQALEEAKVLYASGRIGIKEFKTARTNAEYLTHYFSSEMSYMPGIFKRAKTRWGNRINWVLGEERVSLTPSTISNVRARMYDRGKAFRNPVVRFIGENSYPDHFKFLGIPLDSSYAEARKAIDDGIKLFEARLSSAQGSQEDSILISKLKDLRETIFASSKSFEDYRQSMRFFLRNQRNFITIEEYESFENLYAALGVLPTVNSDQLRAAYQSAMRSLEALSVSKPELASVIEKKKALYTRAYQTLSTPSSRSRYDKTYSKVLLVTRNGGAEAFGYRPPNAQTGSTNPDYVDEKLKNYYSILNIPFGSDAAAIKRAYRREAIASHPDKFPNRPDKEERFKHVNEAFTVLGDEVSKASYDSQFTRFVSRFGYEPGAKP